MKNLIKIGENDIGKSFANNSQIKKRKSLIEKYQKDTKNQCEYAVDLIEVHSNGKEIHRVLFGNHPDVSKFLHELIPNDKEEFFFYLWCLDENIPFEKAEIVAGGRPNLGIYLPLELQIYNPLNELQEVPEIKTLDELISIAKSHEQKYLVADWNYDTNLLEEINDNINHNMVFAHDEYDLINRLYSNTIEGKLSQINFIHRLLIEQHKTLFLNQK